MDENPSLKFVGHLEIQTSKQRTFAYKISIWRLFHLLAEKHQEKNDFLYPSRPSTTLYRKRNNSLPLLFRWIYDQLLPCFVFLGVRSLPLLAKMGPSKGRGPLNTKRAPRLKKGQGSSSFERVGRLVKCLNPKFFDLEDAANFR